MTRDARQLTDAPSAHADGASWHPTLGGSVASRALHAVEALASHVATADLTGHADASLSSGTAGLSIFFAQLHAATSQMCRANEGDGPVGDGETPAALAVRYLDDAVELVSTAPLGPSLYAGFTGVAWAAQIVGELLNPDSEDPNEAIDDALLALLRASNWEKAPYDLIHGLTGLGLYALERWPRPAAIECVTKVVDHLAKRARFDETGAYWWTGPSLMLGPRRERYPAGGVDLGVAHGVAGVIPFLARMCALGDGESPARSLLDGAVRWLLGHALQTGAGPTIPYFMAEGAELTPARSAWCYGDPGVAATLLVAAREVAEPAWEEAAVGLALRAAERPPERSGVTDLGFCHGSAGLAHLFNRMHQMTGEGKLADAASYWLERTLEPLTTSDPDERKADGDGSQQAPWNGRGLLEGAAGVGLVLLAASTEAEPIWDRMFLVSRLAPQA